MEHFGRPPRACVSQDTHAYNGWRTPKHAATSDEAANDQSENDESAPAARETVGDAQPDARAVVSTRSKAEELWVAALIGRKGLS